MIHVDRNRVPRPVALEKAGVIEIQKANEKLEAIRQGERFPFKVYQLPSVREALVELFYNKCAYCEIKLPSYQPGDASHFRPKSGVVGNEGQYYPHLYYWLANAWDNLLLACTICDRTRFQEGYKVDKGSRFPLEDEAQRAQQPGEESREKPLLLDPCVDFPEEHLVFDGLGNVYSSTPRGQTTIAVLDLNRSALVEARKKAAADLEMILESISEDVNQLSSKILALTDASQEYAGMKRQLVGTYLERRGLEKPDFKVIAESIQAPTIKVSKTEQRHAKSSFVAYQQSMQDYSLEKETDIHKYFSQRRLIERIQIRNIKAIRSLDLDLTRSQSGRTPWMMLLGENATGKSTVLQAVALTLAGMDYFTKLVSTHAILPSEYIRKGVKSGQVKVKLSGFSAPHTLTFHESKIEFKSPLGELSTVEYEGDKILHASGKGWEPQVLLLGYGATRLLPRKPDGIPYGGLFARVDNLFDPFVPLVNAKTWLLDLDEAKFEYTNRAFKELVELGKGEGLVRKDGTLWVKSHRVEVPVESLSDGYQTILALAADILSVVLGPRMWTTPEDAEGVVLLDEIGSHLHPTWKMRFVPSLRKFLPGMQFIATTQEPLCLRGIQGGEVVVMQRDEEDQIIALSDLPSPTDFRVDQLLTSEFFGLHTTSDPEVEQLFTTYYTLLAKDKLSPSQARQLEDLKVKLRDRKHLGDTVREEILYAVIDKTLATKKLHQPQLQVSQIKEAVVKEVSEIWQSTLRESDQG